MKLIRKNDKWYIDCGRVTREWRAECQRWCWETWGADWGDVDTTLDHTIFIFKRTDHASWFVLRWG
jgi:hypothetical protein